MATGAYATGKDVVNGNWGQAAVDLTGTLLGGAGLVEDIGAKLTMSAAREAWDEGLPVLDLARAAERTESWGGWLEKVAAGLAVVGDLTDRFGVFEGDPESEAGGPDAGFC